MANYTNLKNIIDQYITTNGQGDITGAILNDVLKSIVNSIGADFLFGGIVEPSSNVGTPDQNVFYIAIKDGTYTNFGNVTIPNGITIFKWNGSWSNQILFAGDGGVFDITAYHSNTKYADLTAALGTNGANVPQSLQKGGMSVKFVRSSDNKYMQYFLTKDGWSSNESDWEKLNLEEEVSQLNLKVGMVSIPITEIGKYVVTNAGVGNPIGAIISNASYKYMRFPVEEGDKVIVNGTGGGTPRLWCFIDNADKIISVANADQSSTNLELIVPQNATAIIINDNSNRTSYYIKKDSSEQLIINTNKRIDNIDKEYSLISPSLKLRDPENYIFNPTVGYINTNGAISDSSSYKWITVDNVEEGDIITCWNVGQNQTQALSAMRFICAYDTNGDAVSAKGSSAITSTYAVPSGIKKLAISLSATYFASPWDRQVMIIKGATAPQYFKAGAAPLYEAEGQIIPDQLLKKFKSGQWRFALASSTNGDGQQTRECHIVKNLIYTFTAKVTSFNQLYIGQDSSLHNYFSLCTIGNTKVIFKINGNTYEYEHGLTIAHYINIRLVENDNTRVTLTLESNGGAYTKSIGWYGFGRGGVYKYLNTNCVLSDVVFTVSCRDLKDAPIHIHGDSYIAILESEAKWTHWLVADGYGDNTLINAFPGASSSDMMESLKCIIEKGLPRVVFWACGMNDGADTDSSTPNATWLAGIQDVITICKQNGIEPVLATIPTVPSILHEAKNDWVRNSGYRYVDFAKAVGADASGVWYADMLSQDNVHPTTLGAKALYHRVLCDLPDVTFKM